MSGTWRDRDVWLNDEEAMLDHYDGPRCPECGYRGDECICDKKQDGENDHEDIQD